MRCEAIKRDVGQHLSYHRTELEPVSAESGADHNMLVYRMGVHDEVLVRRLGVKANAAFTHRRIGNARDMARIKGRNLATLLSSGIRLIPTDEAPRAHREMRS